MSCPGVSNTISGFLAIGTNYTAPRGLVMVFTGDDGMTYWSGHAEINGLDDDLRSLGFMLVEVRWVTSWLESSPGDAAGPAHLGCRPATVIKYVYDAYYRTLGIAHQNYRGGFVLTGNSGGATQLSYALTHYGLKDIVDAAVATGGPPHAALAKSCLNKAGEQAYWFGLSTRDFIDRGFGFFDGNGPAARQDSSFVPRWLEESVATGGTDYFYPATRVHFIIGSEDAKMQTVGGDFYQRLIEAHSPALTWEIAPNTPHAVHVTAEGRAAIKAAILAAELAAPSFSSNAFQFTPCASTNLSFVLQASSNLSDWEFVATNGGAGTFTETNAARYSSRFYRLRQAP